MDPIDSFKQAQKQGWAHFIPFEMITTSAAAQLVKFAGISKGQRVLDVGCGTGVVALTAARLGADVTGLDLTPELLARAAQNSEIAGLKIEWIEGDAEKLPFPASSFDVVVSQFGHIFAPRPDVATSEMLRVLKPGGAIAFSTWPPDLFTGRMFALGGSYLPPPPAGVSPPTQWGVPSIIRERLGAAVQKIIFSAGTMLSPALSPAHQRAFAEANAGPVIRIVAALKEEPARLAAFRRELDALAAEYFADNAIRQDFLMTRALKN